MSEKYTKDGLLNFLYNEYVDNGYMYSGSWPYNSLLEKGFTKEVINALLEDGLIQRRNCEGFAYELSVQKRHQLLSKYSLCSKWFEKEGNALLAEIRNEIATVSLVKQCISDSKMLTVDTLKNMGDDNKPNKIDVYCPFEVGQIIHMEYDLPKRMKSMGYAGAGLSAGGKAIGQFIVTDIFHNMLFYPSMNMIELQSIDDAFNKIHPDARTMQVFEDVVLKRVKDTACSLEDKIRSASEQGATGYKPDVPINDRTAEQEL